MNQSIRINLNDNGGVRSIDIDTLPPAPPSHLVLVGGTVFGNQQESIAPERQRFVDNNDGTVTDNKTGLMWSKDDAAEKTLPWAKADETCKALRLAGHDDWSLPTREQLLTLVDDTRHEPAIDTEFFPSCKSDWYWTATDDASEEKNEETGHSDYAWFVNFNYGYSNIGNRDLNYRVRAVRGPARQ